MFFETAYSVYPIATVALGAHIYDDQITDMEELFFHSRQIKHEMINYLYTCPRGGDRDTSHSCL